MPTAGAVGSLEHLHFQPAGRGSGTGDALGGGDEIFGRAKGMLGTNRCGLRSTRGTRSSAPGP